MIRKLTNRELVSQIESILKAKKKDRNFFNNEKIEDIYFELIEEEKSRIELGLRSSLELLFLTALIKIKLISIGFKDSFHMMVGKNQLH
ncbi:hypothetical protein [Schinkia azotoformans]|uniref:hypothetical protein n=1 Tax=Schinkia azotoformans TaxID=1454 RepID=UPI002DB7B9C8|nr:hypothetical protein [Schinkia azotoformans]MEC1716940.1 hypothetical protein [Schinkia azotoformans]MEC1743222.1 hypothetical protein [Schinkia azotoformans]MEC1767066.1 hypothetical protein [Schinkia azotoformans]MEC1786668.1 hypothetical protein [Schinkia azotoformans]MED4374262.1 hypothetical protein [Schinkia azotoformans]